MILSAWIAGGGPTELISGADAVVVGVLGS
jgi:hypothetical protein